MLQHTGLSLITYVNLGALNSTYLFHNKYSFAHAPLVTHL